MDNIQIPAGVPDWTQRVVLDGEPWYLSFRLNERCDRWHFSLADSSNDYVLQGRKALTGRNLLRGIGSERKPPGMLMIVDYSGLERQPTFANFGTDLELIYISFDEVVEIGA